MPKITSRILVFCVQGLGVYEGTRAFYAHVLGSLSRTCDYCVSVLFARYR